MDAASLLILASSVGVGFGWQPMPDGSPRVEYLVQIDPEMLTALQAGLDVPIVCDVPPHVGPIGRVRIVLGRGELPQEMLPGDTGISQNDSPSPAASHAVKTVRRKPPIGSEYPFVASGETQAANLPAANPTGSYQQGVPIKQDGALQQAQYTGQAQYKGQPPVSTNPSGVAGTNLSADSMGSALHDAFKDAEKQFAKTGNSISQSVSDQSAKLKNEVNSQWDHVSQQVNQALAPGQGGQGAQGVGAQGQGTQVPGAQGPTYGGGPIYSGSGQGKVNSQNSIPGQYPDVKVGQQSQAQNAAMPSAGFPRYAPKGTTPMLGATSNQEQFPAHAQQAVDGHAKIKPYHASPPGNSLQSNQPVTRLPNQVKDPWEAMTRQGVTPGNPRQVNSQPHQGAGPTNLNLAQKPGFPKGTSDPSGAGGHQFTAGNSSGPRSGGLALVPNSEVSNQASPMQSGPMQSSAAHSGAVQSGAVHPGTGAVGTQKGVPASKPISGIPAPPEASDQATGGFMLLVAWVLLIGSVAGNLYLFWSYVDIRSKYHAMIRSNRGTYNQFSQVA